jgi:RHS repeat-associated protein
MNLTTLLRKYYLFLFLSLFFLPNFAQAATSDCIQTHSDGTYDCFEAKSTWTQGGSNPSYATFEELQFVVANICNNGFGPSYVCYEQTALNTPPLHGSCSSSPTCGLYTQTYDTTSNDGGIYAITYYPIGSANYNQTSSLIYHIRTCPQNTTAIYPDSTSLTLCKPSKPLAYKKECSTCDKLSSSQSSRGEAVVGDPINAGSGAKTLVHTDYVYNSYSPFIFKRYYTHTFNDWRHEYERRLSYTNTSQGEIIVLQRPNFQTVVFKKSGSSWNEYKTNYGTTLTQTGNDFIYKNELDEKEYYTNLTSGFSFSVFNFTSLTTVNGNVFTLSYTNNLLSKITDPYGNEFNIVTSTSIAGCNNFNKITSITGPGSKTTAYTYDSSCLLTKVTYPDSTFKEYGYGSYALREVIDENLNTYQTTNYTSTNYKGYAGISEGLGSSASIDKISLDYNSSPSQITITDSLSNSVVLTQDSANKITGYDTQCTFCTGMQGSALTYDSNGYVSSVTDYRGYITNYTWNSRGLPPKNDGTSGTETRAYSFTYNTSGQLTEVYGPRYVSGTLNDKTTLTYSSTGQVATITNGLGQVTTFSDFNDYGKPQTITDSSSRVNVLTYDSRGRVLTSTYKSSLLATDGETTTIAYDNAGLVTQVTSSSGAYKKMYYDTAHRLTKVEEYNESATYLGKTEFTLDYMSNLTALKVYNASNVQIRTSTAQYDSKNRLYKAIGSLNQTDTYTYDNNGNLTVINDAANNDTTKTYDALNRLSGQTNADTGTIGITYRVDDNIATVTDPKSLTTTYTYNGFGNLIGINSPDTGVSSITRDKSGNASTYTDARGQASSMTYDDLNRITGVSYTGSTSENVTVTYDSCTNGVGRVCSVTDISGTQNYTYNSKGRLATKAYTKGTFTKTVGYSYNSYGQLSNITYPSGKVINYSYVNNKISSVSYTDGSTTTNIATGVTYEAFNPELSSYTWGNSATYNTAYSADCVISSITAANAYPVNKSYGYDSRFNITGITESGSTARSATATYDSMSKITNYTYGTSGNLNDYTYNTSEDRTSQKLNSGTATTYNYGSTSHKLTSLSGASTDAITYDNNGNILTASGKTYTYNAANRMATSNDGSATTSYLINFMGQRTKKSNTTDSTSFVYDENDNVIAEYDSTGNLKDEYVYLDNRPVALIRSSNLYYIYTDHLNTPRAITDTANNLQWTWENKEAFGNNLPTEIVTGFKFNFRLPGQYFDSETNLNYNIHRDYNPVWGRYMSSDPLGLAAGINTYGYVSGNSLGFSDKLGLKSLCDALFEIAVTQKSNVFLNGSLFLPTFLTKEVIPSGGGTPLVDFKEHFTHNDGREYDVQYIQTAWSLTKSYGNLSPATAWGIYGVFGAGLGSLVNNNYDYFTKRNLAGDFNGLLLGQVAANLYPTFYDFVKDFCRNETVCTN